MSYADDLDGTPSSSQSSDSFSGSFFGKLSAPANQAFLLTFAAVGALFVASRVLSFLRLLLSLFVLPGKNLSSFAPSRKPSQSWAQVTGSTDGIGLEFATQLAQAGYNLILVSRTESKLASVTRTLSLRFPKAQTKTLAIDFAAPTTKDYEALSALIADLDVGVLINNVGKSHDIPVPFAQTTQAEMDDIVTINVMGTLRVTTVVLPGMIARKRGLILTMGSFGGLFPTSLLATYSGSKAFLQQWSSALGAEVAPHGITVELVQSYLVTSAMSKVRRATALIPTPKAFVCSTLGKIGRSGGAQGFAYTSTPWWSHALMQWFVGTAVGGFTGAFAVDWNKSMHESIRKRALRKREGKKGQ